MSLTLLLRCNDINETRQFYRSAPHFETLDTRDNTLTVQNMGAKLIFTHEDLWKSAPICSGTIYFSVPDVDTYFASIRDKVSLVWPIQDMSYGSREFGIRDCNGYTLAFQQRA
jgi:predicted enzyme related to lactoylglutathione lyase